MKIFNWLKERKKTQTSKKGTFTIYNRLWMDIKVTVTSYFFSIKIENLRMDINVIGQFFSL